MKKNDITLIAIVILLLMFTLPAYAGSPKITGYRTGTVSVDKSYSYRTVLLDDFLRPVKVHKSNVIQIYYKVYLDYIFKWELSTLMGEPVVGGWLAYKPTAILPHNSTPLAVNTLNNDELYKRIRVSELKMRVWFFRNNRLHGAAHEFDTGVAWKPFLGYSIDELMNDEDLYKKYRSYNVPGSPDWNNLFYNIKGSQQAKLFFTDFTTTEAHIKSRPSDYEIVKVDIDTSEVDKYIYEYLQRLEENIIKEKTTPLIAEKDSLESKVARQVQEEKNRVERLEKEEKTNYAAKSFEDQMDDLIGNLEDEEIKESKNINEIGQNDKNRIDFLTNEIKNATNALNKYTDKNKNVIHSNFDNRKKIVSKIAGSTTGDVWVDNDSDLMWYYPIPKEGGAFVGRNTCYPAHVCKKICDNLKIDNYFDWRLPSIYEVMTLFNPKRTTVPNHNELSRSMNRYIDLYPKAPGTNVGSFTRNYQEGSIFKEPLGSRISKDEKEYPRQSGNANHGIILTSSTFRKTYKQTSLHYFLIYIDSGSDGIGIHTGNSTHITCIRDSN